MLFTKLQLIGFNDNEKQIKTITRSPEQYNNLDTEESSCTEGALRILVEEDLEDTTIQHLQNCCVVFGDMLDSNPKQTDSFFTRGRHNDFDIYYLSQSYFDLPKRTFRNNSNVTILFHQTLKDVEHIYKDIAGFDVF